MSNLPATINFGPTIEVPDNAPALKVDVSNPALSFDDVLPDNFISMEALERWLAERDAESRILTVSGVTYERDVIKHRTRRGKIRSVSNGNVTIGGSKSPFGYDLVKIDGQRVLVINEAEAEIVILIFHLYAVEGYSLHGIADYLDQHGVPKPAKGNNHKKRTTKKAWSTGTISGILNNETYVGRWYYRKTKRVKDPKTGKYKNVARPREEWILVNVPSIIDESTFEAAQVRRKKNKRQKRRNHNHLYVLGGMIRCGHCGNGVSGMTKVYKKKRWGYYKCNAHHLPKRYGFKCDNAQFKVEEVDSVVYGWVREILISPEMLQDAFDKQQGEQESELQPLNGMLKANSAKLKKLHEEKQRLIDAYMAGVLNLDEFAQQKTQLEKRIADLDDAISALQNEMKPRMLTKDDIESIEEFAAEIRKGADLSNDLPEVKREILQKLNTEVTLTFQDGIRWADVRCYLGENRIPVGYTTTWCTGKRNGK